MLGYFLLILLLICTVFFVKPKYKLLVGIIGIFIFMAFRFNIGWDYPSYVDLMKSTSGYNSDRLENEIEFFSYLLLKIGQKYGYYYFFILNSLIVCYALYIGIKNDSVRPLMSLLIFLAIPFFFLSDLSIVRNAMAYGMIFLGFTKYRNKKVYQIILIVIGYLFHQSALIGVIILLPLERLPRNVLLISIIISVLVGELFFKEFISFVSGINSSAQFSLYLEDEVEQLGGAVNRYLIYGISLFILLNYNVFVNDNKQKYYVSLLSIGAILVGLFSQFSHVAIRLGTFFIMSILLLIPYYTVKKRIPTYIINIAFILMFIYCVYYMHVSMENRITHESPVYPYKTYLFK